MKDQRDWGQINADYLSAAVEWIRQRLQREFEEPKAARVTRFPKAAGAMALLSERFGLSAFDQQILMLTASVELDVSLSDLCARAQHNEDQRFPTFGLALRLFDDSAWESITPAGPLRFWHLIEVPEQPRVLTSSQIRIDERILHFLKGINQMDRALAAVVQQMSADEGMDIAPTQRPVIEQILNRWRAGDFTPVQLTGAHASAKALIAARAAAEFGHTLYSVSSAAIPAASPEIETLGRMWQREAALAQVALYVDTEDQDGVAPSSWSAALGRLLSALTSPVFVACAEPARRSKTRSFALRVPKPNRAEQRERWVKALDGDKEGAETLAGQFSLNFDEIARIESVARAAGAGSSQELSKRVWEECVRSLDPGLTELGSEVRTTSRWEDIVLPHDQFDLLRTVAAHVKHRARVHLDWGYETKLSRGLGTSALFVGDSGVGKTLAAEILANELRLPLYRVDLSSVMSKYIGEAEKHLRRIFDVAEDGGAVLFFDECDALFGKRTEVTHSHDRFANVEIDYLLQRMEVYRGIAILATNMRHALDPAFTRRMRFIVHFPFPGLAERRRLWMRAFPAQTPLANLDYDRLARFTITGGTIQNIALHAAFRAAEKDTAVDMATVLAAARIEFIKIDRPINEADFEYKSKDVAAA
ncbi:MAG TPA: ATP-binding protein [Bryobacteraceae bacterium]|nr:ATP-binding protein [Bryobacteraceae bacterium]